MKNRFEDYLGQRKAEIISAALKLADQVGITGITTKRLAREVGVVEGALYRHIKTKFDIFSMILDISDKLIDQKFKESADQELGPDQVLREFFNFAVEFLEGSPGLYLLLFSDALYVENKPIQAIHPQPQEPVRGRHPARHPGEDLPTGPQPPDVRHHLPGDHPNSLHPVEHRRSPVQELSKNRVSHLRGVPELDAAGQARSQRCRP